MTTNKNDAPHLSFAVEKTFIPKFSLILQGGIAIRRQVGCSLNTFLGGELGIGPDTLEKIQSIFLDGSPVDDLESAIVNDGSTLALSAAMPGLVGATMRRGGAYSSFRSTITYHETNAGCVLGEGIVRLKLFNLLMNELGPGLLGKGVFVRTPDLTEVLSGQSEDFWKGCKQVLLDGKTLKCDAGEVNVLISHYDEVFLSVSARG